MNRLNRRRFLALSSAGVASAVLVACGNEPPSAEELNPTQIPDVAGAPPTLAPITSTPQSGGGQAAPEKPAGGGEAAGGGSASVTIEAGDLFFDPAEFSVAPGGTIVLNNSGMLEHDLAVDEWGGVVIGPLAGGENGEYTVAEDAAVGDSFTFYCSIPGHREAGMEGTVTIAEAGAAAGGEEASPEGEEAAAGGGAASVDIEAGDIYFEPKEISVAPGGTINLTNAGMLEHDLAVDDWGGVIIGPLNGGENGSYTVPADAAPGDSFEFYCSIPGHKEAGMTGTLTIAEAGGGEAAAGGEEASPEGEEATAAASPSGEQAAGGGATEVALSAGDLFFEPTEFEIAPGGTITLTNEGQLEHDLAVDEWGGVVIDVLAGGESGTFTVPEDATPGDTYEFYCSVPGHKEAGMVGKVTVAAGGGDAAAASPSGEESAGGGASSVDVDAHEMAFEPKEFEIAPGGTINLVNSGVLEHDMAVDAWDGVIIGPLAGGGESGTFTVPDDVQPGETFDFYCSIPGHKESGMVGKITIV